MSAALVSLFVAVGGATWVYNKFMRRTGNLTQKSVTAAIASGIAIFFIFWIIFSAIS